MNLSPVTILIVRLFSMYCFLQGVRSFGMLILASAQRGIATIFQDSSSYLFFIAPVVLWFLAMVLFWVLAPLIAEKASPVSDLTITSPTTYNVTLLELYELAVCALGILSMVLSIPHMADAIYFASLNSQIEEGASALQNSSITAGVVFIFSLFLVFGRKKIAKCLV